MILPSVKCQTEESFELWKTLENAESHANNLVDFAKKKSKSAITLKGRKRFHIYSKRMSKETVSLLGRNNFEKGCMPKYIERGCIPINSFKGD